MQKEPQKRGIKPGQKKNVEETINVHFRVPKTIKELVMILVNEQIQEARKRWKIKQNITKINYTIIIS